MAFNRATVVERDFLVGGSSSVSSSILERFGLPPGARLTQISSAHPEPGGRAVLVTADIGDTASTVSVVQSCDAVVNAVGLYIEQGDATFQSVHVDGAARLAMTASQAGVSRLIHISGIGADPRSASDYVHARANGESRVLAAFPNATIIRPSVMFGPGDSFFNALDRIARFAPIIPLFGIGATCLQPVFVDDVAEAVARALRDSTTMGRIFELGGPQVYTYRSLLEFVLARKGRRRLLMPLLNRAEIFGGCLV